MTWKRVRTDYRHYGRNYTPAWCSTYRCPKRATVKAIIRLRTPTYLYACDYHKEAWD